MAIYAEAKNGGWRSIAPIYWGWIRHVIEEEGVVLPKSESETISFSSDETKRLASAIRARAEKIRKGLASRDANSYVDQIDSEFFPSKLQVEGEGKMLPVDFDNPDSMDDTATWFDLSGGVTLTY